MAVKTSRQKLLVRCAFVLSLLMILGFGASIVSLIRIQFVQGESYRAKAQLNQFLDESIPAQRGTIFDVNGKVLAKSASVWKIYINPKRITELPTQEERDEVRKNLAATLSKILDVDRDKVFKLTLLENSEYAVVKSQVELDKKEEIANLRGDNKKKDGQEEAPKNSEKNSIPYNLYVGIKTDEKRYYPNKNFASAIIGFCGSSGGSYGIEKSYNGVLTGKPGRLQTVKDAHGDAIPFQFKTVYEAEQGNDIYLTVDEVIQHYLENSLKKVYTESKALGVYGIVMDVNTGAILAMASTQNYDLNIPYAIMDEKVSEKISKTTDENSKAVEFNNAQFTQWRNFAVSDTYEPGSVFKIFTVSAAIEEKAWSMTEHYYCNGSITVNDRKIFCNDHAGHGTQNITQALEKSCNPFFITVGQRLGAERFFNYFEAFGFTENSGIDLPAEAEPVEGVTYHAKASLENNLVELSSSAFGQSFQVSPIQVITATAAIANGGMLMRPYIIAKKLDDKGNIISVTQPFVRRQVISKTTADTVTAMMEKVVSEGKGSRAQVEGYKVAGKSGTSEKLGSKNNAVIASFSSFAPAEDPKIAVLIVINEPKRGKTAGGWIAAPVASEVIGNTLKYMNIAPTEKIVK